VNRRVRLALLATVAAAGLVATVVGQPSAVTAAASQSIPNQLASAVALDKVNHTVTLPLYRGVVPGRGQVYFILTDTSDLGEAVRLGINWSPKLHNALGTKAVQPAQLLGGEHAQLDRNSLVSFAGGVDFSGQRLVVPGPDLFPVDPATHAGPVADAAYSSMFTFGNGIVYNGAQVANNTGTHPKVLTLDPHAGTVTLRLTAGFYLHRNVLYLSTEASTTQIAALENATYAPNLAAVPQEANDDPSVSAREPIIPVVNGPRGVDNPQRQGLQSAVAGEGDPLNIIREEPECSDPADPANCSALEYAPMWDVHPVAWTQAAIDAGQQVMVTSHQDVEALFNAGQLVSAAPDGPSNQDPEILGLRAAGVVINCPPMFVALS
jgi:hypothetical protein